MAVFPQAFRRAMGLIAAVLALSLAGVAQDSSPSVATITIHGAIGPATADYLKRATDVAAEMKAECLIVNLDTPGGLLESTKTIVQDIYASPVPVVVYVQPAGATATSAGCFITLASHVAAMTPGTSIGAAHPVMAGGGEPDETMKEKMANFAVSFIESIAKKRGRNVEWAAESVRESASITAEKALELQVIEIVAEDLPGLLIQLDGRTVDGRTLATRDASVNEIPMLTRERVFQMLWRPEVMFILMLIAVYGIIGELSNPGAILPGVIGAIALVLALYLGAILPVNIAGVALIVLAVILFTAEAFTPTFGLLTAGGVMAFLLGALMLFDTVTPDFRLSLWLIIPSAIITAAFFLTVVSYGLRAQRLPIRVGKTTLPGQVAEALTPIDAASGRVFVEGENWSAVSETPVATGEKVEVVEVDALRLKVKPLQPKSPS